ncbi:hypothetical protein FDG2_1758 [Candidatus Protofrankia californiensis]|uniref:Uncharacterized protein n=1 Tax=Candidatus Protofrankia californiensis TaxID=1839754 RepID=A0A1C3NWC7_9ACTN|nr:hypothetical protein FDG2_1758 [Candidatus Protofrankia californiensis]
MGWSGILLMMVRSRYVLSVATLVVAVGGAAWLCVPQLLTAPVRPPPVEGPAGGPAVTAGDAAVGDPAAVGAGLATRRVRVGTATLTVEIAETPAARMRGLMARTSLPFGTGMLFVFDGESTDGFYMYRTLLPLSIAFSRYGRIVTIREMTPCVEENPNRCEIYRADTAYTAAIEAPAGTFSNAGIHLGDMIEFL